jgi:hypothetical protein
MKEEAMGKYEPLEKFLKDRRSRRWRAGFREIETLLGFKLPHSALKYPAWWSNDETGHSHAKAWLDAGWRTEEVDLTSRKLTFARVEPALEDKAPPAPSDPWGCMAGTVTIMPDTDLTAPTEEWNAEAGRLLNG